MYSFKEKQNVLFPYEEQSSVKKLSNLLERRDELAVTMGLDNKIYAIGGFGGDNNMCMKTAERYNF